MHTKNMRVLNFLEFTGLNNYGRVLGLSHPSVNQCEGTNTIHINNNMRLNANE